VVPSGLSGGTRPADFETSHITCYSVHAQRRTDILGQAQGVDPVRHRRISAVVSQVEGFQEGTGGQAVTSISRGLFRGGFLVWLDPASPSSGASFLTIMNLFLLRLADGGIMIASTPLCGGPSGAVDRAAGGLCVRTWYQRIEPTTFGRVLPWQSHGLVCCGSGFPLGVSGCSGGSDNVMLQGVPGAVYGRTPSRPHWRYDAVGSRTGLVSVP
jgi:hypothetical protein